MLVEIGIHISVRILHAECLRDVGCPGHEKLQFTMGMVFRDTESASAHARDRQEIYTVCHYSFYQRTHKEIRMKAVF